MWWAWTGDCTVAVPIDGMVTNNPKIMGRWVNTRAMNALGWLTTAAMFAATIGLVITFLK